MNNVWIILDNWSGFEDDEFDRIIGVYNSKDLALKAIYNIVCEDEDERADIVVEENKETGVINCHWSDGSGAYYILEKEVNL